MTCPKPNLWQARRECFLVAFPDPEDGVALEDALQFVPVAMADLKEGDIFTLEASDKIDPLYEQVAVERMWRVVNEPYHIDGVCQVDGERI